MKCQIVITFLDSRDAILVKALCLPKPFFKMSRRSIYQPKCSDIAADGAYRGILVGCAWSASFRQGTGINLWALHNIGNENPYTKTPTATVLRQPKKGKPPPPSIVSTLDTILHTAERTTLNARTIANKALSFTPTTIKYVGSNVAAWSLFFGVFNGTMCASERLRKKSDWVNAFFAGCSAASVFGLRNPNPKNMIVTCLFTGCFTGGMSMLRPKQ